MSWTPLMRSGRATAASSPATPPTELQTTEAGDPTTSVMKSHIWQNMKRGNNGKAFLTQPTSLSIVHVEVNTCSCQLPIAAYYLPHFFTLHPFRSSAWTHLLSPVWERI